MAKLASTMSKVGRPTKFSDGVAQKVLDAIKGGNYLEPACRAAGVSYGTVRRWLRRGKRVGKGKFWQFWQDYLQAAANAELEVVRKWQEHLPESYQACRDLLARRYPQRWANREKRDLKVSGGMEVKGRDESDIAAAIDKLAAEYTVWESGQGSPPGSAGADVPAKLVDPQDSSSEAGYVPD